MAGVPAVAFDLGALAERIRDHGGGWLTPLASGAEGMAGIVESWLAGALSTQVPGSFPSAIDVARAHVALYERNK